MPYIAYHNMVVRMLCDPLRIGRAGSNDLILMDRSVSKHHADITCVREDSWRLVVHSRLGVVINGVHVNEYAPLAHGDVVVFGKHKLIFFVQRPSLIESSNSSRDPDMSGAVVGEWPNFVAWFAGLGQTGRLSGYDGHTVVGHIWLEQQCIVGWHMLAHKADGVSSLLDLVSWRCTSFAWFSSDLCPAARMCQPVSAVSIALQAAHLMDRQ